MTRGGDRAEHGPGRASRRAPGSGRGRAAAPTARRVVIGHWALPAAERPRHLGGPEPEAGGGHDRRPRADTHAAEDRLPLSSRRDVLAFQTAPADREVEVTGTVAVKLRVNSTAI